jgi:hypothetical protein
MTGKISYQRPVGKLSGSGKRRFFVISRSAVKEVEVSRMVELTQRSIIDTVGIL